jgi:hypothetical protein
MVIATTVARVMRNRERRSSVRPAFIAARRPHARPPAAVLIAAGLADPSHISNTDTTVVAPDKAGREARERERAEGTNR